ncbi:uncharacterized protein coro1cb isoform X2 [Heptranchias perlo]|uniref:uncharacterized protein coro1cb isoform X2 n=1 Tax=Heptranchias perlo TaxID=212740 RepID=UPI00355A43BA
MEQIKSFEDVEETQERLDDDSLYQAISTNTEVSLNKVESVAPFHSSEKQRGTETSLPEERVKHQEAKRQLHTEEMDEENSVWKPDSTVVKSEKGIENANSEEEASSIHDRMEAEIKGGLGLAGEKWIEENACIVSTCRAVVENEPARQQQEGECPAVQQNESSSESVSGNEMKKLKEPNNTVPEPTERLFEERPLNEQWLKKEGNCKTTESLSMAPPGEQNTQEGEISSNPVVNEQKEIVETVGEIDGGLSKLAVNQIVLVEKHSKQEAEKQNVKGEGTENTTADSCKNTLGENPEGDHTMDEKVKVCGSERSLNRFLSQTELYITKPNQQASQLNEASYSSDLSAIPCGDVGVCNQIPQRDQYSPSEYRKLSLEAGEWNQIDKNKFVLKRAVSAEESRYVAQDDDPERKSSSSITGEEAQMDNMSSHAMVCEQISQSNQTSKTDVCCDFSQAEETKLGSSLSPSAPCSEVDRFNIKGQPSTSCQVDWVRSSDLEQAVWDENASKSDQNGKGASPYQVLESAHGFGLDHVALVREKVNAAQTVCSGEASFDVNIKEVSPSHNTDSSGQDNLSQQGDQLNKSDQIVQSIQRKELNVKHVNSYKTEDNQSDHTTQGLKYNLLVHGDQASKTDQTPQKGQVREVDETSEDSELCKTPPSRPVDGHDQADIGGSSTQNISSEVKFGQNLKGGQTSAPEPSRRATDSRAMTVGQEKERVYKPGATRSHTGIKTAVDAAAKHKLPEHHVGSADAEKQRSKMAENLIERKPDIEEVINVSNIKKAFETKEQTKEKRPDVQKKPVSVNIVSIIQLWRHCSLIQSLFDIHTFTMTGSLYNNWG